MPAALQNSVEIAKRCNVVLTLGKPQLPNFPTPPGMTIDEFLVAESKAGLEQRLIHLYPDPVKREAQRERYESRLKFETDTICNMKFPGYFLIVAEFIKWAKENGVPVGPGRGSGAGSLVAYSLLITDLDPLQYNLLFERFLNPERVSMPDFDIDFCQANRDRVIDYVKDKYGKDAVSQIATFGTLAARAAIRDVGRVLDFSYGFCDGISKLIPNKPGMSVTLQYPPNPKKEGDKNNYAIEMEPVLAERIAKAEGDKIAKVAAADAAARTAAEAEANERGRFEIVAERYIAQALVGKRSAREIERLLRRGPLARWNGRLVAAIRRADVADLMDDLRERSPATARLTFAALRSLFSWCVERELMETSPCFYLKAPPRPAARDRVLGDDELKVVWGAASELGFPF
eukprot:gene18397-37312_t